MAHDAPDSGESGMLEKTRSSLLAGFVSIALGACAVGGGDGEGDLGVDRSGFAGGNAPAEVRYIVRFSDWNARGEVLSGAGARLALELPSHAAVAAYMPEAAAEALAHNPRVELVEPDPVRELFGQILPYGIPMVQATEPVFATDGPADVKVCIIDSGLYTGHEDFAGLSASGTAGNPSWSADGCGHGTHVAGTIAAVANDKGVVGVAPSAVSLHIVRVFGDDCSWAFSSTLVAALDACRQAGAKVVNMSLGGSFKSIFEESAFDAAFAAGVLPVAAAGNGGSTATSYPAGYGSVISVAALDANKAHASFSQRNGDVELAAPGVGVLSAVPWTTPKVDADGHSFFGGVLDGAASAQASGALVGGGLCDVVGGWSGKIVLCERGSINFATKVDNVRLGGGVAAVIYNNVPGGFSGTLGGATSVLPAISVSQEDGSALVNLLGQTATADARRLMNAAGGYELFDGTSMATPHVAGVAALVWSRNPAWTNVEIRNALTSTAQDLGAAGRDSQFGFGLVRASAALAFLQSGGGGGGGGCLPVGAKCGTGSDCCSLVCNGKGKKKTCG
jgi:serine protease